MKEAIFNSKYKLKYWFAILYLHVGMSGHPFKFIFKTS